MAAAHLIPGLPAIHPPLLVFMNDLNTNLGPNASTTFLTALGRRLVLGHILPEKEFPKSGAPAPADLGLLMNSLHGLGALVPWAAVNTNAADETTFMSDGGAILFKTIEQAFHSRGAAAGSGAHHPEVLLKQMLSYAECQAVVSSVEFQNFVACLVARDLGGAHALMSTHTQFANRMRRASLFAATGTAKPVPKQEPCRLELNEALRTFDELAGESSRRIVARCLPGEGDLLAPAINAARKTMLKFTTATSAEVTELFITASAEIMQETRAAAALYEFAKVQQCLRVTFMILNDIIGPAMGSGCPDRAVAIMTQWAAYDDRFTAWSRWFISEDDSASESPVWHFAKLIILTPTAKWLSRTWQSWCGEIPDPGSLETCLEEAQLLSGSAKHQLMTQKLAKLQLQSRSRSSKRRLDSSESEDESGADSESDPDGEATSPTKTQKQPPSSSPGSNGKGGRNDGKGAGGGGSRSKHRGGRGHSKGKKHRKKKK
eukprot:COSAG02_NODE_841_length_16613_cov_61.635703_9_plen_489_part_00